MNYQEFYRIAEYGNHAWKGFLSLEEIAETAYYYISEFQRSVTTGIPTPQLKTLCELLETDGSTQCLEWLEQINEGISKTGKKIPYIDENRLVSLLKAAVTHIEAFEDTEAHNVLLSIGFKEDELNWIMEV